MVTPCTPISMLMGTAAQKPCHNTNIINSWFFLRLAKTQASRQGIYNGMVVTVCMLLPVWQLLHFYTDCHGRCCSCCCCFCLVVVLVVVVAVSVLSQSGCPGAVGSRFLGDELGMFVGCHRAFQRDISTHSGHLCV